MVGYGIPNLVEKFTPEECRDEATLAAALAEFQRYYGAHQRDRTVPYDGVPAMLGGPEGPGPAPGRLLQQGGRVQPVSGGVLLPRDL